MLSALAKACLFGGLLIPALHGSAQAGPCSDDIADLGRKLSSSSSLGPATTGTLAGASPGDIKSAAPSDTPSKTGTSADKAMGGTGGTKEINAAVGQVATSSDDVRRQQQGLPTAAQVAAQGSNNSVETKPGQNASPQPDDRSAQAKMELEKARALDQKNDAACSDSIKRTRTLMKS